MALDLQQSSEHMQQHLSSSPMAWQLNLKYTETLYNIGSCYHQMDYTDLAAEKWQEAVMLNPTHAAALYNLGVLSYSQGNKDSAEHYWQQAISQDGRLVEAYYNLGVVSFEQGDEERAIQYWQKTRETSPEFERGDHILETLQKEEPPDLVICGVKETVR
jgi:tetratricopeptide (TPR) repeat protein